MTPSRADAKKDRSPRQIAGWLARTFAFQDGMYVSHETIYRSLFIQARSVLKKELVSHLRRRRTMRRSRKASTTGQQRGCIRDTVSIRERPAEAEDRAVPGHWEGDLITGAKNSHIATLVERHSHYVILVQVNGKDTKSVISALTRHVRYDGFSFLGFDIRRRVDRQGSGKLFITPSKESVKRFRKRLTADVRSMHGANAAAVVFRLNPVVRGLSAYRVMRGGLYRFTYRDRVPLVGGRLIAAELRAETSCPGWAEPSAERRSLYLSLYRPVYVSQYPDRGWSAYYRSVVSGRVFTGLDHHVWHFAYQWARRSHPNKSRVS
ncbi:IS30 family transposase [Streptomyces sp. NPDC055085]